MMLKHDETAAVVRDWAFAIACLVHKEAVSAVTTPDVLSAAGACEAELTTETTGWAASMCDFAILALVYCCTHLVGEPVAGEGAGEGAVQLTSHETWHSTWDEAQIERAENMKRAVLRLLMFLMDAPASSSGADGQQDGASWPPSSSALLNVAHVAQFLLVYVPCFPLASSAACSSREDNEEPRGGEREGEGAREGGGERDGEIEGERGGSDALQGVCIELQAHVRKSKVLQHKISHALCMSHVTHV